MSGATKLRGKIMENQPLFQVDKTKDGKIVKTYKIYINGDIEGFNNKNGCRYTISNHFPHFCRVAGISMAAFFPNMNVRDESSPSSNINPI